MKSSSCNASVVPATFAGMLPSDPVSDVLAQPHKILPLHPDYALRAVAGGGASSSASLAVQTPVDGPGRNELAAVSSALAHEVRAPLRWLTGFSELLVEEGSSLSENGKQYLERVAGAAARLDEVMQDLQRFVAAGLRQPAQQIVALEPVASAVLGSLAKSIAERSAQVILAPPLPSVRGDAQLVVQCLFQLMDNAIKFVEPHTIPVVRIRAESGPGMVRIFVEDNGPGIAACYQEKIFGLFTRLSQDHPGTGAGLALTRQACERMGGRAGVESEPRDGSRFWIELPAG